MGLVTYKQAEAALLEAVESLAVLPDRERAFLCAGSRSCWPEIVRDAQADYGDSDRVPSARLSRRMMARLDAMLLSERAAANAISKGRRAFIGRVLIMKLWPGPEGFGWDVVFRREERRMRAKLTVTSDALHKRYARAIKDVAVRMTVLELGLGFGHNS